MTGGEPKPGTDFALGLQQHNNICNNDRDRQLGRVDSGTGSDSGQTPPTVSSPTQTNEDSTTNLHLQDDDGYPATDEFDDESARDSAYEEESSECWSPLLGLTRQSSCLEAVPEDGDDEGEAPSPPSRRASILDDELRELSIRRTSHVGGMSRRGSLFDEYLGPDGKNQSLLGRRDSLMEAVLAAKRTGWRGLVRTDSVESGASMASSLASISSMGSEHDCFCDDCLLGITDLPQMLPNQPIRPKKANSKRARNIIFYPFIISYKE
ncbi:unnamed protein product, partial [Meganyctiphanes norvegica]